MPTAARHADSRLTVHSREVTSIHVVRLANLDACNSGSCARAECRAKWPWPQISQVNRSNPVPADMALSQALHDAYKKTSLSVSAVLICANMRPTQQARKEVDSAISQAYLASGAAWFQLP